VGDEGQALRILHVYKDYYPVVGGMENHIRILARGMAARGLETTVLVTSTSPKTEITQLEGVKIIKAGRLATLSSAPISLALLSWMRRLEPDITHLHFPYPWGEIAHLVFGRSRRTVITYHSDIVRQRNLLRLYRPFLRRVLARADRIIATSPNYIRSSLYLSEVASKCTVIPLGIDLQPFQTARAGEVEALRERFQRPLLLFVGLLRYYKGLGYLLEAMRDIDGTLLVVGEGPMEQEWQAMTAELGLGDNVFFAGRVDNDQLPVYYQACDLFVLPGSYRSEAFGVVQVEAMASGKPVVSTELGTGTSYVNLDGETGLVVPPRDSSALAQAINQLLADEKLRLRMGEGARQRASQEFSHETMIDRILDLYQDILVAS
jgi:glycosyltransferase involved in cell wall biosynthesis